MSNELVPVDKPGMMQKPDFIPSVAKGTEHIKREDLQLPRLNLAQALSPEVQEVDPKWIRDLKPGDMFNSLTQAIYGRGPLQFIVLRGDAPRWIEFIPRNEGGGIRDMNVPAGDPRTKFREDGRHPEATKFYDFVIMLWPSKEVVAMSMKSTQLKVARTLNALIKLRNAPIFSGLYALSSRQEKNAKGTFFVFSVKNAGWLPDQESYQFAEQMFESIKGRELVIDREPGEDDDDPTTFDTEAM